MITTSTWLTAISRLWYACNCALRQEYYLDLWSQVFFDIYFLESEGLDFDVSYQLFVPWFLWGSVKHIEMEKTTLCVEVQLLFSTLRWSLNPRRTLWTVREIHGVDISVVHSFFVDTPPLFGPNHPLFLMPPSKQTAVRYIHLAWWHQDVSMFAVIAQLQENSSA